MEGSRPLIARKKNREHWREKMGQKGCVKDKRPQEGYIRGRKGSQRKGTKSFQFGGGKGKLTNELDLGKEDFKL